MINKKYAGNLIGLSSPLLELRKVSRLNIKIKQVTNIYRCATGNGTGFIRTYAYIFIVFWVFQKRQVVFKTRQNLEPLVDIANLYEQCSKNNYNLRFIKFYLNF